MSELMRYPAPKQPYEITPKDAIRREMVTTAFTLDGYNMVRNLGVVRGIVVRSRSVIGNLGATADAHVTALRRSTAA